MTEREERAKMYHHMFICDQKKPECKKTHCGNGFCYHTSDIKHAKYGTGNAKVKRHWLRLESPPYRPNIFYEVKRKCTHPEISLCKYREFDTSDKTTVPTSKNSFCIRGRCMAHDRT